MKFYIHVKSPAWADENPFKCKKVYFHSDMSEFNTRSVVFNLLRVNIFLQWMLLEDVLYAYITGVGYVGYTDNHCLAFVFV